ncbi:Piperideine-6-carboxylate dehydrogenase [Moritella viscosa]|uniref:L-piperidine-6-carboxylate dehydrogenase n=1 Tax=Moritella viscosa TaxID=80854 RepID=UPI000912C652|nr:aldehyde dehydrogenase family protein [Moritella viscosa]SGZ04628.1 Piperideine-6-carboxylate dehydrogenase [Moritella viscosa]
MHEAILKTVLGRFYAHDKCYGSAYLGGQRFDSDSRVKVVSPNDGQSFASISHAEPDVIKQVISSAKTEFYHWRSVPAPQRGELVRLFAEKARAAKHQLATMISLESGKPFQESLGEVQELIDVCDFAVGLSRQLYGLTIATERSNHRMMEQWHPIGPVVIITAFNFPMAVWAWNATLSLICGNSIIWKPSSQTPLSALACHQLLLSAIKQFGGNKELSSIVFGEKTQVEQLVDHKDVALVSATGSCAMGRAVNCRVAARMGRTLLELGGNNAMIVCPSADLELAIRAIMFSALGTSGQRCTTLRRLIVHSSLKHQVLTKLEAIYNTVSIGDPFDEQNLMGPLINQRAIDVMKASISTAIEQGGILVTGGYERPHVMNKDKKECGFYITPAIIDIESTAEIVQQETFAPLLYVHSYDSLEQAIVIQNSVCQGLSSAIFTKDIAEAEIFMSVRGSDCGLVNVNIGTSGAEIGGAFGGEKDTGGGRESGSDAWRSYMRRTTNTINYGSELPLAQGISFDMPKVIRQ